MKCSKIGNGVCIFTKGVAVFGLLKIGNWDVGYGKRIYQKGFAYMNKLTYNES